MAKKRYRVVAENTVVAGHKYEADLTEFEEWHLIEAGAVEVVDKTKSAKTKET